MTHWKAYTIGDVCSTISETYCRKDEKVVLINTSDVLDGKVLNHQYVPNKDLKGQFKKTFRRNDILYSEIRPANKRFAFVDFDNTEKYIASTKLMVIRPNTKLIDPLFLFEYLSLPRIISELQLLAETRSGTFPQITFSGEVAPMTVVLPDLQTQRAILRVVQPIERKIIVNELINDNLQQQIEAIFKNQFISSQNVDWPECQLGDIVTLQRGYDLPKDKMVLGEYPVAGSIDTIAYHCEYTSEPPCIVMGRSGNIGNPRLYLERCWAHNTTLFVKDYHHNNPLWCYYMLRTIDYSMFKGGSAVPTLNRNHVHMHKVRIPPIEIQNNFAKTIGPLLMLIENKKHEMKRLSQIRDLLLPKLMSGDIDVSSVSLGS